MTYDEFLGSKVHCADAYGFEPTFLPDELFPFQRHLCEWAIRRGRSALLEDCGLGKTLQELTWAENVVRHTNRHVLLLTPIAVGHQTIREAEKFGISAERSNDGRLPRSASIVVTNYERLHHFSPHHFAGAVCDESSILKNFDGVTRAAVTEFMRTLPFRLLGTATAAPNDYIELGTSSEALGELGYMDMLGRFFKKADGIKVLREAHSGYTYRFRGHAERDFWRWVCSWARAIRRPSDLGFSDGGFTLPSLMMEQHTVRARNPREDWLIEMPAVTLEEQRAERKRTLAERCEKAASLAAAHAGASVLWCHQNAEGDLLSRLAPGAKQVSGSESDDEKEELFRAFEDGQLTKLVTKPKIAGFGMNWQHCAHQTCFPSHSFEQLYQQVRRSWRFGQKSAVTIDVISSEGESRVLANLQRKQAAADKLFAQLTELMGHELAVSRPVSTLAESPVPPWML